MKKKYTILTICIAFIVSAKVCFAQSGTFDPAFGTNGSVEFSPQITSESTPGMALTPDGKVLMIIDANSGNLNFIARLLPNGKPDSSFDQNGILDFKTHQRAPFTDVIEDDSDRILAMSFDADHLSSWIYRFKEDGSLDHSFGQNGHIEVQMFDAGNKALAVEPDHKILVGGGSVTNGGLISGNPLLMRFNNDGTEDVPFNTNTENEFKNVSAEVGQVLVQPDNKIVFVSAGSAGRLFSDGNFDTSFGTGGMTELSVGDTVEAKDAALTIDSKIAIVGLFQNASGNGWDCWRLDTDGSRDPSFGVDGLVTLFSGRWNNSGSFILPQKDTSLILGGTVYNGVWMNPQLVQVDKNGNVNSKYGNNGIAGKNFKCSDHPALFAESAQDGSVLMCATSADNGSDYSIVCKYKSDGLPDTTYGNGGIASVILPDSLFRNGWVDDFIFQSDTKILTVSEFSGLTINRLFANGQLDSSFGVNGSLRPDVSFISFYFNAPHFASNRTAHYIVDDYYPYFFGITYYQSIVKNAPFLVYKLQDDGNLDTTYGTDGINYPVLPGYTWGQIQDVAIQDDGKLLVCGQILYGSNYQTSDAYVIRLNVNGNMDSSFGKNGIVIFDWSTEDNATALAIRSDGKILMAASYSNKGVAYTKLIRLLPSGIPDSSFGLNGVVTTNYAFITNQLLVQPDEKIILNSKFDAVYQYHLARLNGDGSPDSAFGLGSIVDVIPVSSNYIETGGKITLESDGKIDLAGTVINKLPFYNDDIFAARYLSDGSIDSTFATDGNLYFGFSTDDVAHAVHLQDDGKIVIGGSLENKLSLTRLVNGVATGVLSGLSKSPFLVYPNPFHHNVFLKQLGSDGSQATLIIRDALGHVVRSEKISIQDDREPLTLDLEDLAPGIFLLTLQANSAVYISTIAKQ